MLREPQAFVQPLVKILDFELPNQSPPVAPHQGELTRRQTQSLSPMQLRWQVTFKDSPKKDAGAEEPYLPTSGKKEGTGDPPDWSRPQEVDLECLPPLNPHIQEILDGDEMPMAGIGVGDGLQ